MNGQLMSISNAFTSILPNCVKCSSTTELMTGGPLTADEQIYISEASPERRMEFATGRNCAVTALGALGVVVPSLGRRRNRLPKWPSGTVGSITHCDGFCAAAVSRTADTRFLGIDAEPNEPLPTGLLQRIASEREQATIRSVSSYSPIPQYLDRTLFSAKECLFKALFPTVGRYFGFEEVEIDIDVIEGRFNATLSKSLQETIGAPSLNGRYVTTPEHAITVIHTERSM